MLYDLLAERLLLPAYDRLRGDRAARYRTEVQSILDAPAEQVRDFQLQRIRLICQHAYDYTDFYRNRFDELGILSFDRLSWEEFQRIPMLTKTELRERVSSLTSKIHAPSELRKSATGGTTRSPTTFSIDWPANDRRWAATHEWDRRIGFRRGRKIAYLWGASQDFDSSPSWKRKLLNRFVTRSIYLPSSPLDEQRMFEYHKLLQRWQPSFLQAYPTPLAIFSEFLLRNKLTLDIPGISVTAEPLQPAHEELIAQAFGRRPFNWYGARETGRIATECRFHSGLHANAYGLYVEIDALSDYTESSMGRILITDLWNLGMPMIRYDIGDLGSLTFEPCACGCELPRISSLDGRTDDVFINSSGQHIPGVAIVNRIKLDNTEIREMQFLQTAIGKFEVRVVPGARWRGDDSEDEIAIKLSEFMQEPTEVTISIVDSIPREPSGKVRFCKSLVAR